MSDLNGIYRLLSWKVWIYLRAHPDVMIMNNNCEVIDVVQNIHVQQYMEDHPGSIVEDVLKVLNLMVDLDAKFCGVNYQFEQTAIDLFRPNAVQNKIWEKKLFSAFDLFIIQCE